MFLVIRRGQGRMRIRISFAPEFTEKGAQPCRQRDFQLPDGKAGQVNEPSFYRIFISLMT